MCSRRNLRKLSELLDCAQLEYFDGQIAQWPIYQCAMLRNSAAYARPASRSLWPKSGRHVTNIAGTAATVTVGVRGSAPVYQWYSTT